jgi:methanogenic corrinoid protein MtbC1
MAVKDIAEEVLAFNEAGVVDLVKAEIAAETGVDEILNAGLIGAMDIVGKKFSD